MEPPEFRVLTASFGRFLISKGDDVTKNPQPGPEHHEMIMNIRDTGLDVQDANTESEHIMDLVSSKVAGEKTNEIAYTPEEEDLARKTLSEIITRLYILKLSDLEEIATEEMKLHELGISSEKYTHLSGDKLPLPSIILTDFLAQWRQNKGEKHEK